MITVVNTKHHVPTDADIYVGRGSPLGNPFRISISATREQVIGQYAEYLPRKIAEGNIEIRRELNRVWKAAKAGDVNLVCFCAPRDCHANIIKKLIEEKL
jgi:Domain of unknown function (DUF4326)